MNIVEDFLLDCGIVLEHSVGIARGRNIRLNCNGLLDVGEENFDRFANSTEFTFDVNTKLGRRKFKRWLDEG